MSSRNRDHSPHRISISPDYGERSRSRSRYRSRSRSPNSPHYRRHKRSSHKAYLKHAGGNEYAMGDGSDYDSGENFSHAPRRDRKNTVGGGVGGYDRCVGGTDGGSGGRLNREQYRDRGEREKYHGGGASGHDNYYHHGLHGVGSGNSSNAAGSGGHHRSGGGGSGSGGGGRRERRSTSKSRWERKSEERKFRDTDRYDRDRDSMDSDCSSNGGVIGASGSEIIGYKSQPPNNTIMIRGLAQHITENDIRQDIIQCGLMPKDIRLIRKKDTGASRGFAFVEFTTLAEATRWMEMKQGILMLQDQYRAIMQYSIPKELCPSNEKTPSHKASADWFCIKCGAQNFKRRDNCFKCHASRMESEEGGSGSDEICNYATKTIMLRNLDALTTEDTVMSVLNTQISDLVKTIAAVAIGRDPLTSTSRGICYLGTESTVDALALYGALSNLLTPLTIDGKTVILSYCKYNMGDTKNVYAQPDHHASFANTASVPTNYALHDVQRLAEYAAGRYAKTDSEYQHYLDYYRGYFAQQIAAGNSITLHQENQMDAANAAAAVAQSAIQQMNASRTYFDSTHMSIPSGTDGKRYPIPDTSKYSQDKSSGYFYDSGTGLYYDPNSQYYWNNVIQKYLYWDREKLTYVLAPTSYDTNYQHSTPTTEPTNDTDTKKVKPEKQDKVKVAKKIAKDMERWAKTLNQKKDHANATAGRTSTEPTPTSPTCTNPTPQPPQQQITTSLSLSQPIFAGNAYHLSLKTGAADIGFSVLEKKPILNTSNGSMPAPPPPPSMQQQSQQQSSFLQDDEQHPLVAAYGESESSDDEDGGEDAYLDFTKLICNLCKRQLNSAEALAKHAQLSELHKKNLEAIRGAHSARHSGGSLSAQDTPVYRDRARERRLKYGNPDEPAAPSKLKEKYLKSREIDSSAGGGGSGGRRHRRDRAEHHHRGGGAGGGDASNGDEAVSGASVLEPISAENVGNKLLQKMGWTEGQGLGKSNQGRTTIIQAEQRTSNVGLGNKSIYTGVAGESYKDCVKKMMYARYQELSERD